MSEEKSVGGIEFSNISDSEIHTGDITVNQTAGGDIVGRDKTIIQQFINVFTGPVTIREQSSQEWVEFDWKQAAEKYKKRMTDLYGHVRILGHPKPVKIEGIFTDVYLLDKPTAFQRYDIEVLKKMTMENRFDRPDAKRQNGLELVTQPEGHRLFILGKPGAGKTTFLKYITLQTVSGQINKIPIFISLKEWSDAGLELLPFIVKQFEICAFPNPRPFVERLLQTDQAIVLFDGLDEVNQEAFKRIRMIADINNFCKQHHTCQCLITCRIAATEYVFEQFSYVELADFDDEQIRTFVKNWFSDKQRQDDFFAQFFNKKNEGLREVGRIPLLLSLLCLAFEETLIFPQRRVEIYEEAIDALLKKWDNSRNISRDEAYKKLSLSRKQQMLAHIAAETFEAGNHFLRQKELQKQIESYLKNLLPVDLDEDIDGEAILKAIAAQHGIFVERARQIYSFSHLTFQEYFTAKYIAEARTFSALINDHLTDNRWQEVFLLTVSLLDDADEFFTLFRQAIDKLIDNDKVLIELLRWAEEGAVILRSKYKLLAIRGLLITHAFARALYRDREYKIAHELAITFIQNHDLGLDRALTGTLYHGKDFDLTRVLYSGPNRNLNHLQITQLKNYIEANRLLVHCLNLAYVSDRAKIENSLLLPPKE